MWIFSPILIEVLIRLCFNLILYVCVVVVVVLINVVMKLPGFPGGISGKKKKKKNPPATAGYPRDSGSVPGSGRSPGGGHNNPLQFSCLDNPHGQRSLAGYSR